MGIGRHGGGRDGRHAADTGTSSGRTLLRVLALAVVCVVSGIVGGLVAGSVRLQTPAPSSVASGESPVDGDSGGATTYTLSLPDVAYSSIPGIQNQTHMERAKWSGSMPTAGEARILVVRVGFPDILYENGTPFHDGDTTEGISDFIGRHLDGSITCGDPGEYRDAYPYESFYAYYLRSSYGRLRIAGEAYEYVAKRERDEYTSDLESLFAEVLTALGDEIDYADYDGNGDGTLDCVCIRFAGDTTGWATEWWPHVFEASGEMSKPSFELDGKSLGSLVMLSYPASGMLEGRTLIHEIGHTMGLPDYYSSPYEMAEAKADGEEYAGIGTFEMMGANIGDLCGFSKWMLGWIPDGQVTKVTRADDGAAVAKRGDERIEDAEYRGKVRLRVERISGNGVSKPGDLVAIYPEGNRGVDGPLTDFYLLEYDGFAGNNSVYWGTQTSRQPIGSGFRLFRVQAHLAGFGQGIEHNNKTDDKYDQMIELVDPDNGIWHQTSGASNTVPTATVHEEGQVSTPVERNGGYGCMLRKGDRVTPDTTPSTNFREDAEGGRTGICIEVIRVEEDYGLVDVWYE